MVDELSDLYISNYRPKGNIIVGEYLSLWKGRLSFRRYIYISSKRELYGLKLFMLCENETGYLTSFIVYTGSSTDYGHIADNMLLKPWAQYKSRSKVVVSLLKSFFN